MVMQCINLRYQELPRVVWKSILEGRQRSTQKQPSPPPEVPPARRSDFSQSTSNQRHDSEFPGKAEAVASNETLFSLILGNIAKATGIDISEFTDDVALADLGVDSIMGIEIISAVSETTGLDLPATFVFDFPTVGDLRREYGQPSRSQGSSTATTGSSTPSEHGTTSYPRNAADTTSPESSAPSESSDFVKIDKPTSNKEVPTKPREANFANESMPIPKLIKPVDDGLPLPKARITLLKGKPGLGKTPLYLIADGTGSIATYIHLPALRAQTPIYGVDSPFLRCPSKLTTEVGMEGVAKLVVEALIKAHPEGSFFIGGFSAGSIVAYEVARQLPLSGRKVRGLLIIDLCCPRPATGVTLTKEEVHQETDVGISVFGAAAAVDGQWSSTGQTRDHLRAYLLAMRTYHPPPMTLQGRPDAAAVVWAEKGMVNRVADDPKSMQLLKDANIPTQAYPGFMEDPKNGPFACFIPDKTNADCGPNGWDHFVGGMLTLSMDCDHLDMPMPKHIHLLHDRFERVLEHFTEGGRTAVC